MTPNSHHHGKIDGSRDCGRFFLDAVGQYGPTDVSVRWEDAAYAPDDSIRRQIESTWEEQQKRSAASNIKLFDGPLCRLIDFGAGHGVLHLTLGPTSFKSFVGTNMTQANLRYLHGVEAMANPLGVSAAVTTHDGFLVLGRRSDRVMYNAGRIHPIGGMVEPAGNGGQPPDPFETIRRELRDELNIEPDMIKQITCIGLVREKPIVQPELIFDITVDVDAPAVRHLARTAVEADEHEDLVLLMDYPSSVITFLDRHGQELTPVAMAALLLHGLRRWGSGWFASARGYLQTVI